MPYAEVNGPDVVFYYEDSGPPQDKSDYVTLVIVHGTIFHSGAFKPLIPFANAKGFRTVFINLRDYPNSTPYSPDELSVVTGSDSNAHAAFVEARGLEVGRFLASYIRQEKVPPKSDEKGSAGGLAVLAWSFGNATVISMFAHAKKLAEDDQILLDRYLRSYILLDPPFYAFGLPILALEKLYNPLRDPDIPPAESPVAFSLWVSSYYHNEPGLLRAEDIAKIPLDELMTRMKQRHNPNPPQEELATLNRISPETYAQIADVEGALRSHIPLLHIDRTIYEKNLREALGGTNIWPRVRFEEVWCAMSPSETAYAAWHLSALLKELGKTRPTRIWTLDGANHFPHWDAPEKTIELVSEII